MPNAKPLVLLCVTMVLFPQLSHAQSNRQMLREIDVNRDRLIQFTELQAFRARLFDQIDRDGNGILGPAELTLLRDSVGQNRNRGGAVGLNPFNADLNGDGVLTRSEFVTHIPQRLLLADQNGDRALSRSELRRSR